MRNTQFKIIVCDNCKKEFDFESNTKKLNKKDEIIEIGLKCPHCKKFFHSYYVNDDLIKRQKELVKIKGNLKLLKKKQVIYKKVFLALQSKLFSNK